MAHVCQITPGLVALAVALALGAGAHAEEGPAPPEPDSAAVTGMPPVLIEARRRREDPQQLPLSIDLFTGEALERLDIRTTTSLQGRVPGLAICCAPGQANYNFLRGVQGVQAYFAETLVMNGNGAATSLSGNAMYFDMEAVSVLKGPQGTLFGMSTNGGAILYAPRRPGAVRGGQISVEMGDYGRRIVEATADLPLSHALRLRAGVQSVRVNGYVREWETGREFGREAYSIARLALSFMPDPALSNELVLNQYKAGGSPAPYVPQAINPDGPAARNIGPALALAVARQQELGAYRLLAASAESHASVQQFNLSNITTLRLGEHTQLRNILGLGRLRSFVAMDTDGTAFRILDNNVAGSRPAGAQRQLTEELQLQGETLAGRLTYTAGLFHARLQPGTPAATVDDLGDVFGIRLLATSSSRFVNEAGYLHAGLDLGQHLPGLKATLGFRQTRDRRWLSKTSATLIPAAGSPLLLPDAPLDLHARHDMLSYTAGLSYEPARDTLLYLSNSKGYLNGGFNTGVTRAADAPFDPESLNQFELGLKAERDWGGLRARLNLAAYYGLYRDGQVPVTTLINAGTPQQALAVLTRNAAQGRVRGLEWHLQLAPTRALELGFHGSYMSNRYVRYQSLDSQGLPVDLSGTPFLLVPRLKYGLDASLRLPLSPALGTLRLAMSFSHQDELVSTSTLHPQWYDKSPAINTLDLNADWTRLLGRPGLQAAFFITNVLGNEDTVGSFGAYNSLGVLGRSPAVPRMIGLRLRQTF